MRYANKRDSHHADFINDLRKLGFSVQDTSRVGDSFPDLVIGKARIDAKVEIKTMRERKHVLYAEPRSIGQQRFADAWRGSPVILAYTVDDVLQQFHTLCLR